MMSSKANKRRKVVENEVTKKDENSSEEEQEDDTDDQKSESLYSGGGGGGGGDDVIQVDFEAFPFRDEDAERVTHFLTDLFPDAKENGMDLAEISQTIVKQSGIGCVLLPTAEEVDDDEEEDVFGIITVIDLDAYSQVKDYCRHRLASASKSAKVKVETALKSSKTGWIICERLINMPIDIALPSYTSLKQDMESAAVKYDYFVILSKCQRVSGSKNCDEIFMNPEDEFWFQEREILRSCQMLCRWNSHLQHKIAPLAKQLPPDRDIFRFRLLSEFLLGPDRIWAGDLFSAKLSCASCDFPHPSNRAAENSADDHRDEERVENVRRFILVDAEKFDEFLMKLDRRCSS